MLSLDPLIGAISAGNVVVIKPSEQAPVCSSFLANIIPQYLDSNAIKVIQGGPNVCEQLLQQKWDKIFFTGIIFHTNPLFRNFSLQIKFAVKLVLKFSGSSRVGSLVMSAAAKHLTPVTLELGGKCPAILDSFPNPSEFKVVVVHISYHASHIHSISRSNSLCFSLHIYGHQVGSQKNCGRKVGTLQWTSLHRNRLFAC